MMSEQNLPRKSARPIQRIAGFRKLSRFPWQPWQKIEGASDADNGPVEVSIFAPGLDPNIRKLELHYSFALGEETAQLWAKDDPSEIWDLPAPHGELVLEVRPSHSWIVRVAPQTLIAAYFIRGW